MKITIETLRELVKKYPNDSELGNKVRRIVWDSEKTEVETVNPSQTNIFDVIKEEDGKN